MTGASGDPPPRPAATSRRVWRRWLTIGEAVGVGAVVIAGLGYLDAHRERVNAQAERAAHARRESAQAAFVLRGVADGSRVTLSPVEPSQVVQSERYLFPHSMLDQTMEVSSATPQINAEWIRRGLREAYNMRRDHAAWEDEVPVGIVTRYIQDGDLREDASLYRLGFRVEPGGLFRAPNVVLLGVSLSARHLGGELQSSVDRTWRVKSGR